MGVLFYVLFMFFDVIDGNMARITDSATYFGKFLDGVVDTFVDALLPLSIAVGFYLAGNDILFLFGGVIVTTALLFAAFVINRTSFFNRLLAMDAYERNMPFSKFKVSQDLNPLTSSRIPLKKIGNFLTDAKIVILIVAAITGMTKFFLLLFLLSIAIWALALIIVMIINAAEQLNVRRISKWDSRLKSE